MMSGRKVKEFEEYLVESGQAQVDHDQYTICPATAFLRYCVEAKDAVDHCSRHFPSKSNGDYKKASQDSLEHIVVAMVPAIMGHFETYQRHLFAGVFDRSVYLEKFDTQDFFRRLAKTTNIEIDHSLLAAHRLSGANSVGLILSDSMSGWHSPEMVNKFFDAFGFKTQFFSTEDCRRLKVLWQLRHSIAHTGGTLTLPDAQKVRELEDFGGLSIVFEKNFVFEVARKLHPMVRDANRRIKDAFEKRMLSTVTKGEKREVADFFDVHSTVAVWLK